MISRYDRDGSFASIPSTIDNVTAWQLDKPFHTLASAVTSFSLFSAICVAQLLLIPIGNGKTMIFLEKQQVLTLLHAFLNHKHTGKSVKIGI